MEAMVKTEKRAGAEFPSGWKLVTLKDVCTNITDGSHHSPATVSEGALYVSVKDLQNDTIDFENCKRISQRDYESLVRTGCKPKDRDVLFSKDGTVGKVAVVSDDRDFVILSSLALLSPDQEQIAPEYLAHALKSGELMKQALDKKKGVAIRRVILRDLKELTIPLAPLPQQRRIVSAIELQLGRLDAAVARLHGAKAKLKRYKQAVLKAAFTENDWPTYSTRDVTELITDGDHQAPPQVPSGIPFIVITNVKNNAVDFSNTKYVPESYYAQITEKRKPRRGDVLYTVTGSYGIPVLVDHDEPFCFQRHIALLRPNALVLPTYLFSWLQTPEAMAQAKQYATGTAQMTVSLKGLRSFELPVPSLQDQERVVAEVEERLGAIAEMETTLDAELVRSTRLRQAVLKRAFEGRLV